MKVPASALDVMCVFTCGTCRSARLATWFFLWCVSILENTPHVVCSGGLRLQRDVLGAPGRCEASVLWLNRVSVVFCDMSTVSGEPAFCSSRIAHRRHDAPVSFLEFVRRSDFAIISPVEHTEQSEKQSSNNVRFEQKCTQQCLKITSK